jgi:hypothetical protein
LTHQIGAPYFYRILLFHWEGADRKWLSMALTFSRRTITSAVDLFCPNDEAAKEKAKQLVDGHDVELWQLGRKIETFKRTQE